MSSYTTQLRWVIEQALDNKGLPHDETSWPEIYGEVGLADYPIFDEAHRKVLNDKIIRHYYTREIGAETTGRFKMFVKEAMHLIMPYYNQLYLSELDAKEIDPLKDKGMKYVEHAWGKAANEEQGSNRSSTASQNVYQDTPQSEMVPDMIRNLQYATNVTMDDGSMDSSGQSTSKGNYDNMVERNEDGHTQSQADLLMKYRETFLNIDRMVVEDRELSQCFMGVW